MASLEDLSPEARDELALISRQLAENPETREAFLRLTKKARPEMTIDTIDMQDRMDARLQVMQSKLDQMEASKREDGALAELERRRRELISKGKAKSEEDIGRIEKIMLEKGIQNHETAAEYDQWMRENSKPTGQSFYNPHFMNETARDTLSKFHKNPVGAARDEASKALMELRKHPGRFGV